jgi:hypothetical protein
MTRLVRRKLDLTNPVEDEVLTDCLAGADSRL